MALNSILIGVGLLVCFGSIYFIKRFENFPIFFWILLTVCAAFPSIYTINISSKLFIKDILYLSITVALMIIFIILFLAFSGMGELVNVFGISCMFFIVLFMNLNMNGRQFLLMTVLSPFFSLIITRFLYLNYSKTLITETALTGGFIAGIGVNGLMENKVLTESITLSTYRKLPEISVILLCTILLGLLGICVQQWILNSMNSQGGQHETNWFLTNNVDSGREIILTSKIKSAGSESRSLRPQQQDILKEENQYISIRHNIRKQLRSNFLLFIPVIIYIMTPLEHSIMAGSITSPLTWFFFISRNITAAILVYCAETRDDIFTLLFLDLCSLSFIFKYVYNPSDAGIMWFLYNLLYWIICWLLLKGVKAVVRIKSIQPILLSVFTFLYTRNYIGFSPYFVNSWKEMVYAVFPRFNLPDFASLIVIFSTVYLIFKIKFHSDIFAIRMLQERNHKHI